MNEISKEQLPYPLNSSNSQKLLYVYQMAQVDSQRDSLAYILLATNESYRTSDFIASGILQQKVNIRSSYSGRSGKLMDFAFDETVDRSADAIIIDLLTVAINDYLSDKQEQPKSDNELNKVKALMIQLIAKNAKNILNELNIPPYVASMVKKAEDILDEGLDNAFNSWCNDLVETGNEDLVDWMRKVVGPSIFGTEVKTKAKDKYAQYMDQYIEVIKNPKQLYDCYLKHRKEYEQYSNNVNYSTLYDIFGITNNQFNKVQKSLYDDFQHRYSENVNAKYIKELLNGN